MKHRLFTSTIRKIWNTKKKFLSLLCLSLLGVGFFVGIKATSPDMTKTLDTYLDNQNVYDIEVVSSLGLTEEDIKAIQNLNIVSSIVGNQYVDHMISIGKQEEVVRIHSLEEINKVDLVEGKLPEKENEIVVEKNFLEVYELKIGDTIEIPNENLKEETFFIVGVIESPLYFTSYRGTTNIGTGSWKYYFYVLKDTFKLNYYTSIDLTLKNTKDKTTNSSSYLKEVEKALISLEEIKETREQVRYQETVEKMQQLGITMDFPKSTWYLLTRNDNNAYTTFIDATKSITQIGTIFPLTFFVVAILISFISMARMVEEERLDIGTLKGLGFSNYHIYIKNLLYAFLATTIGGIIGMMIGFSLIPTVIWNIYTALFQIPTFVNEFNLYYAFIGFVISAGCICGSSLFTTYCILREKPSELMRPKAPKVGKKIVLEYLPIWNYLSFSNKISIRNIFMFKKRIIVTIIGLAGSTALMLVGFGLKDSVTDVADFHYNNVFIYDSMIYVNEKPDSLLEMLKENKEIEVVKEAYQTKINIYNKKNDSYEVDLIVPKEDLDSVIQLSDKNKLTNNKIILSEKLATLLDVKVGDTVSFLIDGDYKKIEVSDITENYVNHYAYLTKESYENLFSQYETNIVFVKNKDNYDKEFDKQIVNHESVSNLITKESTSNLVYDILSSLNSVVVILIVSSAMLAFVILYNLSSINISERKREISTLKVLGFYDEEVDAYITNENYFITIVGIALGLFSGLYLCHYVISTCEPDYIMFVRHIKPFSYFVSALISIIFTFIVSKITHFNLKKIDMVESLKSNE